MGVAANRLPTKVGRLREAMVVRAERLSRERVPVDSLRQVAARRRGQHRSSDPGSAARAHRSEGVEWKEVGLLPCFVPTTYIHLLTHLYGMCPSACPKVN